MDHIPLPTDAFTGHIRVPFIAHNEYAYDGLPHQEFSRRRGLIDIFRSDLFQGWNPEDIARFIQAWCFFGILTEVFRVVGVEISVSEFLFSDDDGERLLTTKRLPLFMRMWEVKTRMSHIPEDLQIRREQTKDLIDYFRCSIRILRKVSKLIEEAPSSHPTLIAAHACTVLLYEYLLNGVYFRVRTALASEHPRSPYFKERMLQSGWCSYEIARLYSQEVPETLLYFFANMNRHSLGRQHGSCTNLHCCYDTLDYETYKTAHTNDCSGQSTSCRNIDLGLSGTQQIDAIVLQGNIPLLQVMSDPSDSSVCCFCIGDFRKFRFASQRSYVRPIPNQANKGFCRHQAIRGHLACLV